MISRWKWNESEGNQRFITYALSPSEYVFRVQGSNSHGTWNEQGASVRLVILPQALYNGFLGAALVLALAWAETLKERTS